MTPPPGGDTPRSPGAIPGERPGDLIGPYRLLELIGEGGFGEVFLAEQKHPIARRVALKIIKPGMDSKAVIARFEAERQALALMSHPNVAKVLDAGTTALSSVSGEHGSGGRPYFVMELIKGVPITRYCDSNRLTVEQRLKIFAVVCEAVHHAHMKGIIHRDLKPSNILVSIAESGQPRPVVIDFGVAKALAGRLTEQTIHTEQGALIGTPEYMSPEQAEMSEADIDTRADVYALGVILYELLTGTVPFDRRALRGAGYGAMQKFIREEDPQHPSVRLTTLGDRRSEVAAARHMRPEELASKLRRELEWIPLKALRKDRTERYRSAAEMADDVANYLAHRPLIAGPETTGYKVRKFVRRNHAAVAAGSAIAASLVVATGVSIWFGVRASQEKDAALEAAERATSITDFFIQTLQFSDPGKEGKQDMLLSDAMLLVVQRLSEGALSNQPQTRAEILRTTAEILNSNGRSDWALPLAEEALSTLRELHLGDNAAVASTLTTLANVTGSSGRAREAEPFHVEALEMYRRLFRDDHADVATGLTNLAANRQALGRAKEAEALYVQALEMRQRLFKGDHRALAAGLSNLAMARQALGPPAEAEPLFEQALEMSRRVFKVDHPQVAGCLTNLGLVRRSLGRASEAEALLVQALEMYRRMFKGDHPTIALGLIHLASVREDLGHATESESLLMQSLEMYRQMFRSDHPDLATGLDHLGYAREALGHGTEAEPLYAQALEMRRRLFRGDHPDVARSMYYLGAVRHNLGRQAEAESLTVAALEMRKRLYKGDHPDVAASLTILAMVRQALGHAPEAEALCVQALEMRRRLYRGDHPEVAGVLDRLARSRLALGKTAEAIQSFEDSVAMYRRLSPQGSPSLARVLWRSAGARLAGGDADGAVGHAEECVAMAGRFLPPEHPNLKDYRDRLAQCREALGK